VQVGVQQQNKYGYFVKNNNLPTALYNDNQHFYYLQAEGQYKTAKESSIKVDHKIVVQHTNGYNNLTENNLAVFANNFYTISTNKGIVFGGSAQTNKVKQDTNTSNNLQYLHPIAAYQSNTKNHFLEIGASYIASNTVQQIFPHFCFSKKINSSNSMFMLKSAAIVLPQNLQQVLAYNPFADFTINQLQTGSHWKSSAGLVLQLSKKLAVDGHYSYNVYKNAISYTNSFDTNMYNTITVNNVNAVSSNIDIGLVYRASSNIQIQSQVTIQRFGATTIAHLPTLQNSTSVNIQILKNINTKFNYAYLAGISGVTETNTATTISPISDLHAELVWKISKKISLFTQFNNILNNTNARWFGYQSYRNNYVIGLQLQNFGWAKN
jgi:hypothetical protein